MQNIQIFNFNGYELRAITNEHNQVFFVAKDVCDILGYTKSTSAVIDAHCKLEGCTKTVLPTNQGSQEQILINEGNLYRLVLKSKKKESEKFESWVCDEVLPSIRKTGKYEQVAPPKTQAELFLESAQMLVAQEKRINAIETKMLEIEAKNATRPDYFTIMGYAILQKQKVNVKLASEIGRKSSAICKQKGYPVEKVKDPRFGYVGSYPTEVLQSVFSTMSFT